MRHFPLLQINFHACCMVDEIFMFVIFEVMKSFLMSKCDDFFHDIWDLHGEKLRLEVGGSWERGNEFLGRILLLKNIFRENWIKFFEACYLLNVKELELNYFYWFIKFSGTELIFNFYRVLKMNMKRFILFHFGCNNQGGGGSKIAFFA